MKKFAFICLFATMAFGFANAQETEKKDVPANGAKISFTELEHNYGTLQKGGNGDCEFTFKNEAVSVASLAIICTVHNCCLTLQEK